mgnify:CR=1 FL=1
MSASTGFTAAIIKTGERSDKALELALTAIPVRIKDFEWMLNVNLAQNKNKMEKLHDEVKIYELSAARWAGASVVAKEGESFGSIMGNEVKGD